MNAKEAVICMSLKAASIAIEITPDIGIPIGGNVRADSRSRGVHDPLYANILYLKNDKDHLLFIGLDVIGVHKPFVNELKKEIRKDIGVDGQKISVFATHTHSGPDLMEAFKTEMDPHVLKYMDDLKEKIIQGLRKGIKQLWNARLSISLGIEDTLSFNRRLVMKDGTIRMNWEHPPLDEVVKTTGPVDPELFVWTIRDDSNTVRALFINYTLHPAILVGKDWLFSRDFVHDLTVQLQQSLNPDLVVLFANGAEGNINHINIHQPDQKRGFEEAKRVGLALSEKVMEMTKKSKELEGTDFFHYEKVIHIPARSISKEEVNEAKALLERTKGHVPSLLDGVPDEIYAQELLYMDQESHKRISTLIQIVVLSEMAVVFLPGEFFVELGLEIKAHSPFKHTIIVGLANDYIGYVPNKEAFTEGGYEVRTARTSQLVPETGDMIVSSVLKMLHKAKEVK